MTPSKRCETFIQGYERYAHARPDGCCEAYLPTPHDVPTCGWGSTGPDVHMGLVWTREQADERFAADLARFAQGVSEAIGGKPTTQRQFDAMVALAYNIGLGGRIPGFRTSTVLRKHRAGDYVGAAAAFSMWNKQAGEVLDGLTKRRAAEANMYRGVGA